MASSIFTRSSLADWRGELRAMGSLGVPMALTQLVQFSINTIDVLMIGRLGPEALAGASLGLVIFFALFMLGFGPAMAVSPLVSQVLGADPDNVREARRSVRMGLWVIIFAFPFAFILMALTTPFALAVGMPTAASRLAGPYVLALSAGLPFALGIMVLRNFLAALDRTRVPLFLIVVTTLLNAGLNWLLIYGNWGFPRLELVGAGIASSLSHMTGFVLLVVYIQREAVSRRFALFQRFFNFDWAAMAQVVRLAWPISLMTLFEGMLFNACLLITGRIGVDEVAAYQVALNVAALAFMIPFGFAMAGSVRVGLAAGARDRDGIIRAVIITLIIAAGVMVVWGVSVSLMPLTIAAAYLNIAEPDNLPVINLVAAMLPIAAAFMVFDGLQVVSNQALRGLKDVRLPMIFTGVCYWVIGFPLAAYLALSTALGAPGVFWGLLFSLLIATLLLGGRLFYLLRLEEAALFKIALRAT
ncbi:MAG: MATE family efflux transporter [Pseudomonadota bacterium]